MESTWLTKEIFKKALEEKRVYLTAALKTSKGITGYNVYILEVEDFINDIPPKTDILWLCGHSPYWSDSKECYHCTAWGLSRPLEIILSIGYKLGLTFQEMPQTHRMI